MARSLVTRDFSYTLPNNYGDIRGSYTQPYGTTGVHFVEFFIARPVSVLGIHVYETYNPGAVVAIKVFDYDANEFIPVYTGEGVAAPPISRVWKPDLSPEGIPSNLFRLEIDVDSVPGYNEIDCVKVVGLPLDDEAVQAIEAKALASERLKAFDASVETLTKNDKAAVRSRKGKFAALSLAVDIDAANAPRPTLSASGYHPFEMQIRQGILTPKAVLAQSIKHAAFSDEDPMANLVRATASDSLSSVRDILRQNPMLLTARPPLSSLDIQEQWVSSLNGYSAQYDAGSWQAANIIGAPRVYPQYGDLAGAWAQPYNSQNMEWVDFSIETPVWLTQIDVYETFNPGAITRIEAFNALTESWEAIYVNENPTSAGGASRIFTPELTLPQFVTDRLKMTLNCAAVPGYNEIDCIKVIGGTYVGEVPLEQQSGSSGTPSAGPSSSMASTFLAFDQWQRSPLLVATKNGNAEITAYLSAYGADVARKSLFGHSPLTWTVHNAGRVGLRPDLALATPQSPRHKHWDVLMILLSLPAVHAPYAANASYARNELGETVLHTAVRAEVLDMLRVLLAFGTFDPTIASSNGETPLALAGSAELRRAFEESAAKRSAAEAFNGTIFEAVDAQDIYTVAHVLSSTRVNIDITDERGRTPLMMAVDQGCEQVAAFLLYKGANPLLKDASGNSALHLAASAGSMACVAMIMARPRVVYALDAASQEQEQVQNANGDTVLHCAARAGKIHVLRLLLTYEACQNLLEISNAQGLLAAHAAASQEIEDGFNVARRFLSKESGLPTPRAFSPRAGRVCAVCFMPPPAEEEGLLYTCDCNAEFCEECLSHLCHASLHIGEFPTCCNTDCAKAIPMNVLRKTLPVNQLLLIAALTVNREYDTDAVYRQNCSVCNRVNDIYPVLSSTEPRFQCGHCGVFCCVACQQIHPRKTITGSEPAEVQAELRKRNAMDDDIHASCREKFGSLKKFNEFYDLVNTVGQRKCPVCGTLGLKDERCCHLHCPGVNNSGCRDYCYVCGRNPDYGLEGVSVGTHSSYDGTWPTDSNMCPMYVHHLARVDPRLAELGCGTPDCRPSGNCPEDATCRRVRDDAGTARLGTIRVRCAILDFMRKMGKTEFVAMITRFGWRDIVDTNYFEGAFPWDSPDTPSWIEFEPEEVREFFGERLHWFVWHEDIPAWEAVRDAYQASGGVAVGDDGVVPPPADSTDGTDTGASSSTTVPPPAPPGPPVVEPEEPPVAPGIPDRFVFELDNDDEEERRRRPCSIM